MKILLLIRGFLLGLFALFWTFLCSVIMTFGALLGPRGVFISKWASIIWGHSLLWVCGVRAHIKVSDKLPEKGFLYVFNHTSHFDIPLFFRAAPVYPHFGAKSELFKIPIFAQAMKSMGALVIERKNRAKVLEIYKQTKTRVEKGETFALAPEGGRRDGGGQLAPFKRGPFFFAVHCDMPVVPIVFSFMERALPRHGLLVNTEKWITDVYVDVLDPISSESYTEENMDGLIKEAYSKMQAQLNSRYNKDFPLEFKR